MKKLLAIALLLGFALSFDARGQTSGAIKLSGSVVDGQGNPVANAAVDFYYFPIRGSAGFPEVESTQHTSTDGKGGYEFSVREGAGTVVAKKAGSASAWKTLQSIPTGAVAPLILGTPSTLAGIVVDEKNRPVANAEVSVSAAMGGQGDLTEMNYLFGKAASDLFSARTSADGHFRITEFPAGAQANLTVKAPGKALRVSVLGRNGVQMEAHGGQEDIKLVTEPPASIEGKVVVRDTGAPLALARIQLQPVNGWIAGSTASQPILSGKDGTFRVPDVAAGSYRVMAIFTNEPLPEWVSDMVPVTVASGETVRDVKIQAVKGGVVEVRVIRKNDRKGMPSIGVSAYSEGYQAGGMTGPDGVTRLRLPAGNFTVFAMSPAMSQAQTAAVVVDGETNRVSVELSAPLKIAGTVRDPAGAPVANTSVGVFPNFTGSVSDVRTDDRGHYEVNWQPPAWAGMQNQKFYLLTRNTSRKLAAVHEVDESTTSLDIELKGAMSLSAQVQDAKGKAIPGATAYVMMAMENSSFPVSRSPVPADGQGRIFIEGLPGGESYTLTASANGYGTAQGKMETADPKADHYDFPPMVLKLADRKLAGRVLGTDGQPAPGVRVWIHGEGQPNGNAVTDAAGRFSFDAICEGAVSISANSQGNNGNADVFAGDTNVVIRFNANNRVYDNPGSLTLSGTVYDSDGNPAVGAQVCVTPAFGQVDRSTTDTNGEYTVHWQAGQGPRGAKYFVVARDIKRNLAGLEEIDAKKTHVSVRMEPGFSVTGTVEDIDGKPLTSANVNLNMMVGPMGGMVGNEPIKLDSDGAFTIPALPKGQQYNIHVSAKGYGSAQKGISKTQSQTNSMEIPPMKLKTADRDLAGEVLGKDGKPLPGVQIYTYGMNQPNVNARTDAAGHFQVKVCDGPINVNAYVPQATPQNNYGTVQARGGDMHVVVKIGVSQMRQQPAARAALTLKPQPWTFGALTAWQTSHKKTAITLIVTQGALLLGAAGIVLWVTLKRKE